MKSLSWETQWALGKAADQSKRQDIFVFYWFPDYADPFSWFINLYRSSEPPFFNLSYLDDAKVDSAIDGLQVATATDRTVAEQEYVDLQDLDAGAVSPVLGVQTTREHCSPPSAATSTTRRTATWSSSTTFAGLLVRN